MKIEQSIWTPSRGWEPKTTTVLSENANLVLAFGARDLLADPTHFEYLRKRYPKAHLVMASTAGEIIDTKVFDGSIVVTAIHFEKTELKIAQTNIRETGSSVEAGRYLTDELLSEDLCHILVISDGQLVNGSALVPQKISLTGGLAGDGPDFKHTLVGLNEPPDNGNIAAIGFYGTQLAVSHGTKGGWDPFGPERIITRSEGNKLFELDGQNALELYKNYLGPLAKELPGSALLFPLSITPEKGDGALVRTILSVDESDQSMTFAGDVPQGTRTKLMKANFDRLVDGAVQAAESSLEPFGGQSPELALLISCVGRKLVLNQRVEEEVEETREVFGSETVITGFYSYGEISPLVNSPKCELHNQTMTITTMREI